MKFGVANSYLMEQEGDKDIDFFFRYAVGMAKFTLLLELIDHSPLNSKLSTSRA